MCKFLVDARVEMVEKSIISYYFVSVRKKNMFFYSSKNINTLIIAISCMEIVLSDCFKETQNQNCNHPLSTKHTTAAAVM